MAERRAMTSGLSLSAMATEGGCWVKVATGGGAGRGCASVRSMGASWATEALGVMGDTGGRFGDADAERLRERSETDEDEASLDEAGRGFVSTRSAGMAAGWATSPGAEPENRRKLPTAGCHEREAPGLVAGGPEGGSSQMMSGGTGEQCTAVALSRLSARLGTTSCDLQCVVAVAQQYRGDRT